MRFYSTHLLLVSAIVSAGSTVTALRIPREVPGDECQLPGNCSDTLNGTLVDSRGLARREPVPIEIVAPKPKAPSNSESSLGPHGGDPSGSGGSDAGGKPKSVTGTSPKPGSPDSQGSGNSGSSAKTSDSIKSALSEQRKNPKVDPPNPKGELTSKDAADRGKRAVKDQDDRIAKHAKDETYPSWKERYIRADDHGPLEDMVPPFVERNLLHDDIKLNLERDWYDSMIVSKSDPAYKEWVKAGSKAEEEPRVRYAPVSAAFYSREQGTIVATSSYKEYDLAVGTTKPLPNSEILFQQWQEAAGDQVNKLRFIVRAPIANMGTTRIMEDAHRSKGIPVASKGTFTEADTAFNGLVGDAWYSLMGTENARGTPMMLGAHHNALGDKVVTKIHTWPHQDGKASGYLGTMVLELGHR